LGIGHPVKHPAGTDASAPPSPSMGKPLSRTASDPSTGGEDPLQPAAIIKATGRAPIHPRSTAGHNQYLCSDFYIFTRRDKLKSDEQMRLLLLNFIQ
jgi:hypothetical protein